MLRWSPLLSLLTFVAIGIVWRDWYQRRRYGSSGIVLFRSKDAHARAQAVLIPLLVLAFGTLAVLDALRSGPSPDGRAVGLVLSTLATIGMAISQLEMGASWRVGIDPDARPGLVTTGLYRFSRNPIYSFFLLACLGFVLQLPGAVSVALLVSSYVGIRIQVRREEQYLDATYGPEFRAYRASVGRFLPWLGRS